MHVRTMCVRQENNVRGTGVVPSMDNTKAPASRKKPAPCLYSDNYGFFFFIWSAAPFIWSPALSIDLAAAALALSVAFAADFAMLSVAAFAVSTAAVAFADALSAILVAVAVVESALADLSPVQAASATNDIAPASSDFMRIKALGCGYLLNAMSSGALKPTV